MRVTNNGNKEKVKKSKTYIYMTFPISSNNIIRQH